jgi:hypothetical protein
MLLWASSLLGASGTLTVRVKDGATVIREEVYGPSTLTTVSFTLTTGERAAITSWPPTIELVKDGQPFEVTEVSWTHPPAPASSELAASVTGTATVSAALTTAIEAAGSLSATVTTTAALTTAITAAASVTATATVTADLTAGSGLAASVTGTATVTGDLTTAITAAAAVSATATTTAALTTAIQAAASVAATTTVTADLTTAITAAASVTASASVTADLLTGSGLTASVSATATVTGALTTAIRFAGTLEAQATVLADLLAVPLYTNPDAIAAPPRRTLQVARRVPFLVPPVAAPSTPRPAWTPAPVVPDAQVARAAKGLAP